MHQFVCCPVKHTCRTFGSTPACKLNKASILILRQSNLSRQGYISIREVYACHTQSCTKYVCKENSMHTHTHTLTSTQELICTQIAHNSYAHTCAHTPWVHTMQHPHTHTHPYTLTPTPIHTPSHPHPSIHPNICMHTYTLTHNTHTHT